MNQIEQVTQEMQRVTDEGSETQLQDQQTQREAKVLVSSSYTFSLQQYCSSQVSAEIITREGAQWMMEHDRWAMNKQRHGLSMSLAG